MRRLFLMLLLTLLAAVGLVALIERDPGYILVSWGLTTIETSLWVGLLLLLVFNVVFYYSLRLVRRLLASRGVFSNWLSLRAYSRQLADLEMQLAAGEYGDLIARLAGQPESRLNAQELRLLARAYRAQGNWSEVIALLPRLKKRRVLDVGELAELVGQAYLGLLSSAEADLLKQLWQSLPAVQRNEIVLIECYGRRLVESGDDIEAEKVLTKAIKKNWDGRLVAQYGRIRGRDPARRLKQAEAWLKSHPEDASLMLCLGRLSLRNDLWGKARDYFEGSHRLQASAETCAELARLLFSLGEREKSAQYYREGLLLRETELPDLPLPARDQARSMRARQGS
jgi:HemY protein